ncbi:hypothetical protein [Maribacter sp. Asnod1-A12]|uniref:hypothetical protein n=1 Tax=Maribacter sp. Asnod1-A12 TaxID=3160576 RepID=UPI003864CBBC
MLDLMIGISIMGILGYVGLLVRDYLVDSTLNDLTDDDEDAIFEIDMEHVLMYSDQSKAKDISELKRKLKDFKNRNKFYKM